MSINAVVKNVEVDKSGMGFIELDGDERGQPKLYFKSSPKNVEKLLGQTVWGGNSDLMHGERKIANRLGYVAIEFIVEEI